MPVYGFWVDEELKVGGLGPSKKLSWWLRNENESQRELEPSNSNHTPESWSQFTMKPPPPLPLMALLLLCCAAGAGSWLRLPWMGNNAKVRPPLISLPNNSAFQLNSGMGKGIRVEESGGLHKPPCLSPFRPHDSPHWLPSINLPIGVKYSSLEVVFYAPTLKPNPFRGKLPICL
jgi:hypothetical protein